MNGIECKSGVVCAHEGPCSKVCGGDHYFHTDGTCLRCGKFEHEKATLKPLVSKGRSLKLWNGNWGPDKHAYVAAYSRQDAVNLAIAAGSNPRGLLREITHYWNSGAWGTAMVGVTPERGIWISQGSGKPARQCLNESKVVEQRPLGTPLEVAPIAAELEAERIERGANSRR